MSFQKCRWRSLCSAALALGFMALAMATATAAENRQGPDKPLVFKSRVINAPDAAHQVRSVVADVFSEYTDPKTGGLKKLSERERVQFMARLERAFKLNRSSEGLKSTQAAQGTAVNLEGRFQYIFLSRTNPDGSVSTACVSDWESAQAFLNGNGPSSSGRE